MVSGEESDSNTHAQRPKLRHRLTIARNAASLLTSDVFNRVTTFVVYAMVARFLGAFEFGQLSLALSLFFAFHAFAGAGLRTLITRDVARDRTLTSRYLVHASVLVVAAFALSLAVLALFVVAIGYTRDTAVLVLLLALGLLPYALSTTMEGIFQAWERMHYIAYANIPVHLAKVGIAIALLTGGRGMVELIVLLIASHFAVLAVSVALMARNVIVPKLRVEWSFCLELVRRTLPFAGLDVAIAIWATMQVLVLSALRDEVAVGLFTAAVQLLIPISLVVNAISRSVFPMMCRAFEDGVQGLSAVASRLLGVLFLVTIPAAVGLVFVGDRALLLIYGAAEFEDASKLVRVVAATVILKAVTTASGFGLLAGQKETVTLRIVLTNLALSLGLSLIFIPFFGLIGAGFAVLCTAAVNVAQHLAAARSMGLRIQMARMIWKPLTAAAGMAGYLAFGPSAPLVLTIVVAVLGYGAVLAVLMALPATDARGASAAFDGAP